jgi:hypothetical protein
MRVVTGWPDLDQKGQAPMYPVRADRSSGQDRDRWIRWTTTGSVLLLAAIAAVVSYRHMHTLTLAHGESRWTAALIPLSVDGMIVASSMTLLADSRIGQTGGLLPWPSSRLAARRASRRTWPWPNPHRTDGSSRPGRHSP